jgi:hypothetical protein
MIFKWQSPTCEILKFSIPTFMTVQFSTSTFVIFKFFISTFITPKFGGKLSHEWISYRRTNWKMISQVENLLKYIHTVILWDPYKQLLLKYGIPQSWLFSNDQIIFFQNPSIYDKKMLTFGKCFLCPRKTHHFKPKPDQRPCLVINTFSMCSQCICDCRGSKPKI